MTQKERIQKFLELKSQVNLIEAEMREIKDYFDENLDVIVDTLELEEPVFQIPVSVTHAGKVCRKERSNKYCDMVALEQNFPEAFQECVSIRTINYIEIRKVKRT